MNMKIYKSLDNANENGPSLVSTLLENKLSLEEKLDQIIKSYDDIMLTPNAQHELITKICDTNQLKVCFSRKGDNNERFDALFLSTDTFVVEIEMSSIGILDAPRDLLDDYAVLKSRGRSKGSIIPVVLCWNLPNKRTDYWNVIKDIKAVTQLRIRTISVPALCVLYWCQQDFGDFSDFYLDVDNMRMEKVIKLLREHGIDEHKYAGYFFPYK